MWSTKMKKHTACKRTTRGSHVLHSCWFWKYNNASCLDFQLSFLEETRANPPSRWGLKSSSHNLGCIIKGSIRIIPVMLAETESGYTSAAASTFFLFSDNAQEIMMGADQRYGCTKRMTTDHDTMSLHVFWLQKLDNTSDPTVCA